MKTNIVLFIIVTLAVLLLLCAGVIWHMSNTTEFSRTDGPIQPATEGP